MISKEQTKRILRDDLVIDSQVKQFKDFCEIAAAKVIDPFLEGDSVREMVRGVFEEKSVDVTEMVSLVSDNDQLKSYVEGILSEIIFKILVGQATKSPNQSPLVFSEVFERLAKEADHYLKGVDFNQMKVCYKEQDDESKKTIREAFIPYTSILLQSLSATDLLSAVPAPFRKTVYSIVEKQVLPDLLAKYYFGMKRRIP